MTVFLLGAIALAAVVLSFALVALTLYRVIPGALSAHDAQGDPGGAGGAAQTMSRVLADVEQLAALRERGALTDAEFKAQKTKVLRADDRGERPEASHRTPSG